jgi:uncharacterized membrane protein
MENAILSATIKDDLSTCTLGLRVADKVAIFGGSLFFEIFFGLFSFIGISMFWIVSQGFNSYSFILLNLRLCVILITIVR